MFHFDRSRVVGEGLPVISSASYIELAQRNGYDDYERFERMKSITCSAVSPCEVKVTEA